MTRPSSKLCSSQDKVYAATVHLELHMQGLRVRYYLIGDDSALLSSSLPISSLQQLLESVCELWQPPARCCEVSQNLT